MNLLFSIGTWIAIGFSVLAVLRMLQDRSMQRLMYGGSRYDEMKTVTSLLGFQARRVFARRAFKWIGLWIGISALAHHFQHSKAPWAEMGVLLFPMVCLMIGCVQSFGQMRPAAILVLGASDHDSLRLHRAIHDKLFPHLPVSLLETSNLDADISIMAGEVYRITLGEWQDAIKRFGRSVLVIVVDMRRMTDAIDWELKFIIQEGLQFKTVLLDPSGNAISDLELSKCKIVSGALECVAIVAQAFQGYDTLPSDARPLCDLQVKA